MVKRMAKYADIEPFYDWLADLMRLDTSSYPDHQTLMFYEIIDELDSLQEVVRCKDCKYRYFDNDQESYGCRNIAGLTDYVEDEDFCSYGERKKEELPQGRWKRANIRPKSYIRKCSICGKEAYFCGTGCSYKFCPNCGHPMMNGERKEE